MLFLQMPYIPTRSGQSVFIEDPQQAQQRYQQEWGQAAPAPKAAAPKPQAKPKAQPKRGFDLGQFVKEKGSQILQSHPVIQLLKAAGRTPVPFGGGRTIGQEAPRVAADLGRQLVNAPVAAMEQLGAVTQGIDLGAALAGGGSVGAMAETDPALVQQRAKKAEAAIEALQKTGRDPQGFRYGIKPSVPIAG